MKKLKLNPEFFRRHFAVCLLMVGLGCWFGRISLPASYQPQILQLND